MIDDEMFFAWLDGDLDPADAARVAEIVQQDSLLRERAARYCELRQQARRAFDDDLDEPVPPAWLDRIDAAFAPVETAQLFDLAAVRESRRPRSFRWGWNVAIAASLVAAFTAGVLIPRDRPGLFNDNDGVLIASSALANGFNEARSGVPQIIDGQPFKVGLSVKTAAGDYCREALLNGGRAAQHVLACREGGDWRIEGLVGVNAKERGEYALASGSDSLIDGLLARLGGDALDRAGEVRAIEHRWQPQR